MNKSQEKFGLFTTISMISGIVIGSGIFFKTDDILYATGGSVKLGVLLWVLSAFGIIFGGLTISLYAKKESKAGGLITYSEMAWGKKWGYIAGWFQTIFYFPAITAILSFVASVYLGLLFGIESAFDPRIWLCTAFIIISLFIFNVLSTENAGKFQNITLIIKLGALFSLALLGLVFGQAQNLAQPTVLAPTSSGLFYGLIACAFAFDGWFVAPSVAHEIKNPKKNLSRALILAPLMILFVYLLYFVGINAMLGPQKIMELGDSAVGHIVSDFLGPIGVKFVYAAVFLSIIGAVNGLILGYIRLPYSLALRKEFVQYERMSQLNPKYGVSILSSIVALVLTLTWVFLHFLSVFEVRFGILDFSGLEIDSLPIVLMYIFYISLYLKVIIETIKDKENGLLYGILFPLLAISGSTLVVYGGFSNPNGIIYLLISLLGIGLGLWLRPKVD